MPRMIIWLVAQFTIPVTVAISSAEATGTGTCVSALDCSLNGVCSPPVAATDSAASAGHAPAVCKCDAAWGGRACTQLQLLPAPAPLTPAYPPKEWAKNTTSWGGSVVKGADGVYHMYLAEMGEQCGMTTWTTNSLIRHAVAQTPAGPYAPREVVMPPFAHNPTAVQAPDGTYLIYHIGCGTPIKAPCTDCKGGETGKSCHAPGETVACNTTTTNILWAKSLDGPWEQLNAPIIISPTMGKPYQVDNPSVTFFKNGSLIMAGRGGNPRKESSSDGIITAPSWRGPYTMHTMIGNPLTSPAVEDPFIWQDKRGNFHCLFHKFTDEHPSCGGHAFSEDGFSWHLNNDWAYNTSVVTTDGKATDYFRRERPHLLFDAEHNPVMLFTSLTNWGSSGTGDKAFTFGQQIAHKGPK